jgi:hypothetical protein
MKTTIRTTTISLAVALAVALAPAGAMAKPNTGTNKGSTTVKAGYCRAMKNEWNYAVDQAVDAANKNDDANMDAWAKYGNTVHDLAKEAGCSWAG